MEKTIECEIRSFITEEQHKDLLKYFHVHAEFLNEDTQENHYFDCEEDLRIQKNNFYAKVWLKKGAMHDEFREEIEIKCDKDDFPKLEKLFAGLGYGTEIKWYRNRHTFKWKGIDITVDYTKGYGHILELEKMSTEDDTEETVTYLKKKLEELDITLTPKEVFDDKFKYYKKNWRDLIAED